MAILRTYSATTTQLGPLAQLRLNEATGTVAADSVDGLDGSYENGVTLGQAGQIGDGAVRFDGVDQLVAIETLSGTITVSGFGDSLIAGVGFQDPPDRFSPVLQAALAARGLDATVIDQGVGGETTADGLARVGDVIAATPDVVILVFGTNDANGRVPLGTVEGNLTGIVDALELAGIDDILIAGTFGYFPDFKTGTGYTTEADRANFEAIFGDVATATGTTLLDANGDKFLGGVRVGDAIIGGVLGTGLTPDGLHPTAAGVQEIVPRVLPQTIALGAAAGVVDEPLLLSTGSFEVWLTADDVAGTRAVFAKNASGQGTGGHVALLIVNGVLQAAIGDQTTDFIIRSGAAAIQAGVATHVVLTFGVGGLRLFIDGQEVASDPSATLGLDAGLGNFELLTLGANPGSLPFQGVIDEFAIYDRALPDADVLALFTAGATGNDLAGTDTADTLIGGVDDEILRGLGGDDVLRGNGGDDTLRGAGGDDQLYGGAGQDELIGGSGDDALEGGSGDDELLGKTGADRLLGGLGNDTLTAAKGGDLAQGGAGDDIIRGGSGSDELHGDNGLDQLFGDDGGDLLFGGKHADILEGNAGKDILSGQQGADRLDGNRGQDQLFGNKGDDILDGGADADTLTGGLGSDRFALADIDDGGDQITDFEAGVGGDVLDLAAVLAFAAGDDANDFVRLDQAGGNTKVAVNDDGIGNDFLVVFNLAGVTGLNVDQMVADGNLALT